MINKNFPNYTKTAIVVKIINHQSGANRSFRRRQDHHEAHLPEWNRKIENRQLLDEKSKARRAKVAKRVLRATTRREERKDAKRKGVQVKYSIK